MPRQPKSPSLAQDLFMLGDVYITLLWMAVQRLRHGSDWPWGDGLSTPTASIIEMPRPGDRRADREIDREPVGTRER